ncbi:Chromosomal replication initiator protein DnaA [Paenibacillus sp. S25]|nr:Chromosomal replication initiator protein DnaA [Paenibacillus sp. S25]
MSLLTSTAKTEPEPKDKYLCHKCKDEEGFLIRVKAGDGPFDYRDVWHDCECKNERRIERLMKSSKITEEFQSKRLNNFNIEGRPLAVVQAFEAAENYAKGFRSIKDTRHNSIALLGRPGCGKTHLLMAISNHLLKNGVGVVYFPWVEGFNEIKDNLDMMESRIRQLQQAEVLYIDDMFKGRREPTDFQMEQLFAIINYRYLEKKPILISSEKTVMQICEYDEGIGSRINEMCKEYKVVLTGGIELNYRLQ